MQRLGESWDVVEVVRSLVTEVDELRSVQKIVAGLEARLQVLERPAAPRPLTPAYSAEPSMAAPTGAGAGVTVGDLVADEQPVAPGPEVAVGATDALTEKPVRRVKSV
jgi:hypothetical protein